MTDSLRPAATPRKRDVAVRVNRVAARQEGAVTRRQLLECGMSGALITRWIDARRLHRIHPAVYAVGHGSLNERGRLIAALLYAGRGAALSHGFGAWWMGLLDIRPAAIEICAPGRKGSQPGVRLHHPRCFDRVFHRGLPVVGVPTLLLQVAGSLSFAATRKALARAEFRQLLDVSEVGAVLGRGSDGSRSLRRALERHMPQLARTQNDFEASFLFLCERYEIELPEVNVRVNRFRPDML